MIGIEKIKKLNKVICVLLSFIFLFLFFVYNLPGYSETASLREDKPAGVIVLDTDVPLGFEDSLQGQIVNLINVYRGSKGLCALSSSPALVECANIRAEEASICWSHTRPNGTKWHTLNPNIMFGENLAKGYFTAADVVNAWIASPAHEDVMTQADFTYVGIGVYNGGNSYYAAEFSY